MEIDALPVTFVAGNLHHDSLNQQFAAVLSSLQSLASAVTALQDDAVPLDLSGYATVSQLNGHIAEAAPHSLMVKWGSLAALVGADLVVGNTVRTESGLVTLSGGTGTFTYDTPFANGVLAVLVTVNEAAAGAAPSFDNVALDAVDVAGDSTDVVIVTVWGW